MLKIIRLYKQRGIMNKLLIGLFILTMLWPQLAGALNASITNEQLDDLQSEIKNKQSQIDALKKQSQVYEQSLQQTRQQITTLQGQLINIDQVVAKLAIEIQTIQLEKEQIDLQMKNIDYTIEKIDANMDVYKQNITDIIRQLNRNGSHSNFLQIVMSNKNIGDFFAAINQLNQINNKLKDQLLSLADQKAEMERQQNLLQQKSEQLDELNIKLAANQEKLGAEKSVKNNLLDQTKGQENRYQSLLNQLKAEQNQINNEIYSLEIEARKRMYELNGDQFLASEQGFIWPIPSRKITAYFHDPDYPYRYVYEHPAIDIGSTPQGTPVRAVKSGYVAKVRDTGNSGGYNYIMLVHNEGISSVYGHLSRMVAQEDTFVVQGEIIGYSGGMPGTPGSGNLTTGPHLHLEIRKNGIPVNPLNYLP